MLPQERYLQRDPTAGEVPLLTFNEAQDIAKARWVLDSQSGGEAASKRLHYLSDSVQLNNILSAGA